ncbi:carboxymethylenebutenolidase [Stappia sp. BW2]|uniref:dienelactone hydrolase family protein n=1 Tax=Stappia sp. BW2 TaxID=2592622 RepID=UPI0011DEAE66|nr:dienelactone hydrolase family protein [Stappia sp. BW2]TYC63111.1 carboxymethylenebutenolidase [Stappia sp. BW2]
MNFKIIAAAALFLASAGSAVASQAFTTDMAVREEIYPFATQTLSDEQFLTGAEGKAEQIGGILRLPKGKGPFPAVVLMHGSSGIGANIEPWVRQLNARGIATFTIDSLTGRGFKKLGDKQAALGRLNYIVDIYGALGILAHHDAIDAKRIGLLGFSRGGQAALYASVSRFNDLWNKSDARFATYVPFYPNCVSIYKQDEKLEAGPVRIFHGGADDYNPAGVCEKYTERLKEAGADIEMTVYPEGEHGFDVPTLFGKSIQLKTAQTARDCKIEEGENGILMNGETGKPFTYQDQCVVLGPHVGGSAAAAEASYGAVLAHFAKTFGLN